MPEVMLFEIFGMETEACAKAATEVLRNIVGIEDVEVNSTSCCGLVYSSKPISSEQIVAILGAIGFHAQLKDRVDLP